MQIRQSAGTSTTSYYELTNRLDDAAFVQTTLDALGRYLFDLINRNIPGSTDALIKAVIIFEQVKVYEAANCADGSLVAIFYFSESEFEIAKRVVKSAGYEDQVDKAAFLIDCRADSLYPLTSHSLFPQFVPLFQ